MQPQSRHHHHHNETVPIPMLIAAGTLICAVLALTAISTVTGIGLNKEPTVVAGENTLLVRFLDEEDGSVGVYDWASGERVHTYPAETGHFVRTTLRSLALDRKREGIGDGPPFLITVTPAGRLFLEDTVNGNTVALEAFGDMNTAEFAQLLAQKGDGG